MQLTQKQYEVRIKEANNLLFKMIMASERLLLNPLGEGYRSDAEKLCSLAYELYPVWEMDYPHIYWDYEEGYGDARHCWLFRNQIRCMRTAMQELLDSANEDILIKYLNAAKDLYTQHTKYNFVPIF